jgi:serine phosphatase RsbU (regulator of sigma subunit)
VSEPTVHVLLVEDDEGDAVLVQEMLSDASAPVEVTRVRSIAEARELVGRRPAACVLLDLGLPDARGLEALAAARDVVGAAPIVVLTGHDDERAGIEALGAGAQEYLVKGQVDGPLLQRAIRYAIERAQAQAGARQLLEARLLASENARLERGLLPNPLIRDPAVKLATTYRPGRRQATLGGDFYDAVELADGRIVAMIGDVSGHGPDEAALGTCLRIGWRALMLADRPLEESLVTLDRVLTHERHDPDVFATAAFVSLSPQRDRADFYIAGHPPPLLVGPRGAVPVTPARVYLPLGVAESSDWEPTTVELEPGGALLLYTDGLIEGSAGAGAARLGVDGLVELVSDNAGRPMNGDAHLLRDLVRAVEELNGGELTDDVAMALLSWG